MAASSSTSRLAGLPRIPKVPKKTPKRKSASPPKPKARLLPPPPPPPKPIPAPPATPFSLNPSDDDTLSDVSSSSNDSDIIIEPAKPKAPTNVPVAKDKGKGPATAPKPALAHFPSGLAALPALPSLPPLPTLPVKPKSHAAPSATATAKPSAAGSSASAKTSGIPPVGGPSRPVPRPVKRKEATAPHTDVYTSHAPVASTSKASTPRVAASPSPSITDNAPYAPHHSSARSTPSAPQRMSLRQVLALSLQEAEEKAKSQPTSRENSPDATELGRVSAGTSAFSKKDKADRSTSHAGQAGHRRAQHATAGKGKGKERLSDVSDFELTGMDEAGVLDSSSSGDEAMDEAVAAGDAKALERAEERQIRAELLRKRPRRSADSMELDIRFDATGETDTTDDEDLALAWDRNVRALERLHSRTAQQAEPADTNAFADDGEDSDVAVTHIPVGNGVGVVTWSDYEFDDEDDVDEEDQTDEDAAEDQLAATLARSDEFEDDNIDSAAGDFEDELEQLFALSEAAAGPINPSEYDFGNVWLEALSGSEGGSDGDDESGSDDDSDDSDADMIFGPDGELKDSFGWRLADHGPSAASGASVDSGSAPSSAKQEDQALPSATGIAPVGASIDLSTSEDEMLSESTDSSCSDTDIYRYAPRTGALAAVQAPTSADLASLVAGDLSIPSPAKPQSHKVLSRKHKGKAHTSLASIPERAVQSASEGQSATPRGPVMGCFEPVARNVDDAPAALKVVIVDESGVPAPSPFAAPVKTRRRIPSATPSRRVRSDSRVSTTSGTSGAESVDFGSNVGSPILANVVFDFDFESVLHKSLLNSSDDEDGDIDMAGGDSSETDTGAAGQSGPASQATSALADFSRWARIPIGAFRSRTTGGPSGPGLSFAAQAADSGRSKKHGSTGPRGSATPAILRDRKAVDSLHHTLGSPNQSSAASKRAIANRMLTSPVLAPTIRETARPSSAAGPKRAKAKKPKRAKSTSSKRAISRG